MLKAGIIDSGANLEALGLNSGQVSGIQLYRDAAGNIQSLPGIDDKLDHGSVCMHVIRSYVADIAFFVVKIFDTTATSDEGILVEAIRLCIKEKVSIINVSLGIEATQISEALYNICNEAVLKNIPVVAAAHLDDKICFPAHHPQVIGVGTHHMQSPDTLVYVEGSPVSFYTKGEVHWNGRPYFGSSFACPQVTGTLLAMMQTTKQWTIPSLLQQLINKASTITQPYPFNTAHPLQIPDQSKLQAMSEHYFSLGHRLHFAKEVLVFPLHDPLMGKIEGIPFTQQMGVKIRATRLTYDQYHVPGLFNGMQENEECDTIVLGKLGSILSYYNHPALFRELTTLLKNHKHFVVYDAMDHKILQDICTELSLHNQLIYAGITRQHFADFTHFRWLPALQTPVVAVISLQEKTAIGYQVYLHRLLNSMQFDTQYIAPIAQGDLIGAAFSFPVCDPAMEQYKASDISILLGNMMKGMQAFFEPDLFLTGLPGPLVDHASTGENDLLAALSFLKSMRPDALIFVVNEHCTYESVLDNLHVASGATGVKKICFLLTGPLHKSAQQQLGKSLQAHGVVLYAKAADLKERITEIIHSFFQRSQPDKITGVHLHI